MDLQDELSRAEALWNSAHDKVKRGDFADAVRDLADCFAILKAKEDPRLYDVHRRWTEVHQMYVEDGARAVQPTAQPAQTLEARAEAAANTGDLETAIQLYTQAAQDKPGNELVAERLRELVQARGRAHELSSPPTQPPAEVMELDISAMLDAPAESAPVTSVAAAAVPAQELPVVPPSAAAARAEDDWSDIVVDEAASGVPGASVSASVSVAPAVMAPVMAAEDAPVGQPSLDVSISIEDPMEGFDLSDAPSIAPSIADAAPSDATAATFAPAAAAPQSEIALLEELLARVRSRRRPRAA